MTRPEANGTAVFGDDGINLHQEARLNSPVVGQGYTGQRADLICVTDGDPVNGITTWYKLTDVDTGVTGFVAYGATAHTFRDVTWTNPTSC
ncbi:SH3 domain-containing protein [Saccharopolyspora rosea]|uniref:SH3 domain-containing protein n=1 Tax=Saccharopolyspora rosea TaxID=524884 RepID=A0ABW3FND9_9PSEU|nr:SH3 domain-containing protein [Saccharopolyspora rosea]